MTLGIAFRLGRVSNLPTVWTNALVGAVLAGAAANEGRFLAALLALSLFYVAGMYLNDAFDRHIDARERPERPIPAGLVRAETVFGAGFAMMGLALALLAWAGFAGAEGSAWRPVASGFALGAAIVYYNYDHKGNVLSPLWMALCRALVYVTAACAVGATLPPELFGAALLLVAYLIGLTYVAKQETLGEVRNLWPLGFLALPLIFAVYGAAASPTALVLSAAFVAWVLFALRYLWRRRPGDVPRAVVALIAGISLLDAVILVAAGAPTLGWLAVAGFAATILLQRIVPGT
jgi:4-hydroxybenzoate polyprenyltransferase